MKRIFIITILISFDFISFIIGMHPKVSNVYSEYYIHHSISAETYLNITRAEQNQIKR